MEGITEDVACAGHLVRGPHFDDSLDYYVCEVVPDVPTYTPTTYCTARSWAEAANWCAEAARSYHHVKVSDFDGQHVATFYADPQVALALTHVTQSDRLALVEGVLAIAREAVLPANLDAVSPRGVRMPFDLWERLRVAVNECDKASAR